MAKQINIISIQHQNPNGHWHNLSKSLAESFSSKKYKVSIICPKTTKVHCSEIEIKKTLDPRIGQTPAYWTIKTMHNFISEIRELGSSLIMYDGRIPLLMLVLIASRKMQYGSRFYLNLLGSSVKIKKGALDFRYYIMKYLFLQVKKQNRLKLISESIELSDYIESISGLKTTAFPVFSPISIASPTPDKSFGDLIVLEDHQHLDYVLDEIQYFLRNNENNFKITLWINNPNKRFLELKESIKDQRVNFVYGFLENEKYKEILNKHLRHIYVYDSLKYEFATSGKLMESISIKRSIVVPKNGTFRTLAENYYFGKFAVSDFAPNALVKLLQTSPLIPDRVLACSSDETVTRLENDVLSQAPSNDCISFGNSLICAMFLAFTLCFFRFNKLRTTILSQFVKFFK